MVVVLRCDEISFDTIIIMYDLNDALTKFFTEEKWKKLSWITMTGKRVRLCRISDDTFRYEKISSKVSSLDEVVLEWMQSLERAAK